MLLRSPGELVSSLRSKQIFYDEEFGEAAFDKAPFTDQSLDVEILF